MDKEFAAYNLATAKSILDELKVSFCLFLGTALGAYRDHDFCPGDIDDTDLAVLPTGDLQPERIIAAFEEAGFSLYNFWNPEDGKAREISFYKVKDGHNYKVDLFLLSVVEMDKLSWRFFFNKEATEYDTKLIDLKYFQVLGEVEFYGVDYPVPAPIEDYLKANYGDWKTPIHRDNWDWKKDNQCLTM